MALIEVTCWFRTWHSGFLFTNVNLFHKEQVSVYDLIPKSSLTDDSDMIYDTLPLLEEGSELLWIRYSFSKPWLVWKWFWISEAAGCKVWLLQISSDKCEGKACMILLRSKFQTRYHRFHHWITVCAMNDYYHSEIDHVDVKYMLYCYILFDFGGWFVIISWSVWHYFQSLEVWEHDWYYKSVLHRLW